MIDGYGVITEIDGLVTELSVFAGLYLMSF